MLLSQIDWVIATLLLFGLPHLQIERLQTGSERGYMAYLQTFEVLLVISRRTN